jgi:hypothetical protein
MNQYNIIGDIAGEYKTFLALIAQMPQKATVVSVGDMIDRGPDSASVISWFMNPEHKAAAVMGNHEHMMLDWVRKGGYYHQSDWINNGGGYTNMSYNYEIPATVVDWLAALPLVYHDHGLVITHAPINPVRGLEKACNLGRGFISPWYVDPVSDESVLWNRGSPRRMDKVYQVFGHNAHVGLHHYGRPAYASCIDTSRKKILTGMHWPSRKIYQQPFISEVT